MADFPWEDFKTEVSPPWEDYTNKTQELTESQRQIQADFRAGLFNAREVLSPDLQAQESLARSGATPFDPVVTLPRFNPPALFPGQRIPSLMNVAGGLANAGTTLVEGMLSPVMLATLPAGLLAGLAKPLGIGFGAEMLRQTPEAAVDAYGSFALDAPLEEKVEKTAIAAALPLLAGLAATPGVRAGLSEARILRPEVLPPRGPFVAPLNRQLPAPARPIIETEFVDPLLPENVFQPRSEAAPVGGATFVVDPQTRQPLVIRSPESVPFQTETGPIQQPIVPTKPPTEPSGGEISFRAPAQAAAVPRARQQAIEQPYASPLPITQESLPQVRDVRTGIREEGSGSSQQLSQQGGEGGIRQPETQAKPEIVRLATSKHKNLLGDPLGTTYRATLEDYQAYTEAQRQLKEIQQTDPTMEKSESLEAFQTILKENERVKNKYGGMPPEPPISPGSIPSEAKGMQTRLRPGQGAESGAIINPFSAPVVKRTAKNIGTVARQAKDVVSDAIRLYTEPLQEQIGRIGGPVSKQVSVKAGQILSRSKELYGEVTPLLNPAKKQVGKMFREGTTWIRGLNKVDDNTAFNNFFGVNEGAVQPPTNAKRGLKLTADTNLVIGKMAQRANPGFVAGGKLQRILTASGYDFVVKGGEGRENWIQGTAKLNKKPVSDVVAFYDRWKEKLGDPSSDAATLDQISQDFVRRFPRTITHVKTATGWHEVVVSDPFNYLEQAAQRTAHAVAFREVYPLVQHQGKWVQSNALSATREAVMKELQDGSDIVKFDNLVRALQGHPLEAFKGGTTTAVSSLASPIATMAKALMLSANVIPNISETIVGGPAVFLGYKDLVLAAMKLITDNTFAGQLELAGARNLALYNRAFDPSSPVRSIARQGANIIRTATGQQWLNEVQETLAAASAKVYSDRIQAGKMSSFESQRAKAVFRAMGFSTAQSNLMIAGDVALLRQFENRAAAWLTGGNKAVAEMSRLGASRLFNAAFWFHNYPQTRLNQLRSGLKNLVDGVKAKDWSQAYHNSVLVGRQLGGVGLQGSIALALVAAFTGGIYGLKELKEEAKDAPFRFAADAMLAGYGGPLAILRKLAQNTKGGDSFVKELTSLSPPANIASEFMDMGLGVGKYQGKNKAEKIVTLLEGKTPLTKGIRMSFAIAGISERDLELDVAIKAFYKWRRQQPGYASISFIGGTEEKLSLREQMKKVAKALENGGDWVSELNKIADSKVAAASLRAKTLLEINGKPLSSEQLEALRKRIGSNLVDKLQIRDAMIREVARGLSERTESGERKTPDLLPAPTGKFAVDFETDTKRSERVMQGLSPKVREFLQKADVTTLDYTPSLPEGRGKRQLTVEEAAFMEKSFIEALEKLIGQVNVRTENLTVRRNIAQRLVEGARKVALAKTLQEEKRERR